MVAACCRFPSPLLTPAATAPRDSAKPDFLRNTAPDSGNLKRSTRLVRWAQATMTRPPAAFLRGKPLQPFLRWVSSTPEVAAAAPGGVHLGKIGLRGRARGSSRIWP